MKYCAHIKQLEDCDEDGGTNFVPRGLMPDIRDVARRPPIKGVELVPERPKSRAAEKKVSDILAGAAERAGIRGSD